ncbi:hypothetical protein MHYP_G00100490 [Metynnis hypsauchen]
MDVLYPPVLTNSTCSRSAGRMQAGITVLYWVRTFSLLRSLLMSDENLYSDVAVRSATRTPDPDPSNQDDVHYSNVPRKVRNPRNAESSAGTASAFGNEGDVQYATVRFTHAGAADRTTDATKSRRTMLNVCECSECENPQRVRQFNTSKLLLVSSFADLTVNGDGGHQPDLQVEVPERVIEGDNVTLTCKTSCSLSVRPTITWYRNGRPLSSSTDQLHLQPVSREDAGRYLCAVLGQNLLSPEVPLNVRYGPKNISVSISPSGEIVEGSSVNLTCSSDANPRVQNYTWFKGTSLVTKRETYTMKKISSVDSGEYKCKCSNEHGEKYSAALTLNVLYPPKSVSVSISPSGEIVEGSSVTLSCSSDANPPVEYNWFKGTSLVAKGETYTMEKISSVDSGEYKCRSSNEHGENLSEALTLNVLWHPNVFLYIIACTIVGSGGVFLTLAILFIRRKRKGHSAGEPKSIQENLYSNMGTRPSVNNPTDLANQDDGYYSTVELCGRINPTYGAEDEVQYGNIQHRRDKIVQMTQEAGVEYACVRFSRADPAHR